MNSFIKALMCALVGLLAGAAGAVNIETVPVGDPGNIADTGEHSGNPDGQGSVSYSYNIGKYEVTAGQYCEFLNKVAGTDTYGLYNTMMADHMGCGITRGGSSGSYTYTVSAAFVNRPVNWVSFWDGCRFANWLNNGQPTGAPGPTTTESGAYTLDGYTGNDGNWILRNPGSTWALASADEWFKAAYYKGGSSDAGYWDYPTRSNTAPGRDLSDVSGNNANYWNGTGAYPLQPPYYTTVVGEFQNSASPYGTFDQGGNMCEWNESVRYEERNGIYGFYRGVRGGEFAVADGYMLASYDAHIRAAIEYNDYGFRVVQLPEPAMLSMLALAAVLAVRRW